MKSIAFIRATDVTWDVVNYPIVPNTTTPVISVIGTARDGKSTLLNLYYKWHQMHINNKNIKRSDDPFVAKESDDHVTNGIDFLLFDQLLLDCQGMAKNDAKHDHNFALISYLISNIVILTVRQRLDLQVLNNLLPMFSFLPEIDGQFQRPADQKVKLIIRIKDFQNTIALRKDPNYLQNVVAKWLLPTGDHYDKLKEAISKSFEIYPVATANPVKDAEYYEDENGDVSYLDIHHPNFFKQNPSFIRLCELIYKLGNGAQTSPILYGNNLEKLVQQIKGNKNIDFKRLDLYHNMIKNDLRDYYEKFINTPANLDKSIAAKMDGSLVAYNLYKNRQDAYDNLYKQTYIKFKDVPKSTVDEILDPHFANIKAIDTEAMDKNMKLAEQKVKPIWEQFCKKYDSSSFEALITRLLNIFVNKEEQFIAALKMSNIDLNVYSKYVKLIADEKHDTEKKQQEILEHNQVNRALVINTIKKELDISRLITDFICQTVQNMTCDNLKYNTPWDVIYDALIEMIKPLITAVYEKCYETYFFDKDAKQVKFFSFNNHKVPIDYKEIVHAYSMFKDKNCVQDIYINGLDTHLTKIGFLRDIVEPSLRYYVITMDDIQYTMTERFYKSQFVNLLSKFIVEMRVVARTEGENKNTKYVGLSVNIFGKSIIGPKKTAHMEIIKNRFMYEVMQFCVASKVELV